MTYKKLMRRLFADLWHRCARLAENKIESCYSSGCEHVAWWEAFILRCEGRALTHAEFAGPLEPATGTEITSEAAAK